MNREQFFTVSFSARAGQKREKKGRKSASDWFKTSNKTYLLTLWVAKGQHSAPGWCGYQGFMSLGCPGSQISAEITPRHQQKWCGCQVSSDKSPQVHSPFSNQKGAGHLPYLCPTSSTKQHSADSIMQLFSHPQCSHLFISSAPVPCRQNSAGKLWWEQCNTG